MAADDSCIRCGYTLAGLPEDALCPECAYPARLSRDRSRLLRSADPQWLAQTSGGLRGLSISLYIIVGTIILFVAFILVEEATGAPLGAGRNTGPVGVLLMLALVAAALIHIRGCILATRPTHPDYQFPAPIRQVFLLCGAALPVGVGVSMVFTTWFMRHPAAALAFTIAAQAGALAYLFALRSSLRHLEERTGRWSPRTEKSQRGAHRNLVIFTLVFLLLYWFGAAGRRSGDHGIVLIGLGYLFLSAAIPRVRDAIEVERGAAPRQGARRGSRVRMRSPRSGKRL
jgi:hypothetical protein